MELSDAYIASFIPERDELLLEMERFAEENHVPIMQLAGIESLNQLLRIQNPKSILEIGTAIGYSAMRMAQALPDCQIVTIERDASRVQYAKQFIARSQVKDRIQVIEGDALEVEMESIQPTFDAVLLMRQRGKYMKFFENMTACSKWRRFIHR